MQHMLRLNGWLRLWHNKRVWLWWLGGSLLAMILSGAATVSQVQDYRSHDTVRQGVPPHDGTTVSEAPDYGSHSDRDMAYYEEILAHARHVHNRRAEGITLHKLGRAYRARGQSTMAIDYLIQALTIWRTEHDRTQEGWTLYQLGGAYTDVRQYNTALLFLEQALSLARAVGGRRLEGVVLLGLGRVYQGLQQYDTALGFLEQALAVQRDVGDRREEGWALNALGNVYAAMSQYSKAVSFYEQALAIARAVGNRRGEPVVLTNLGNMYVALNQSDTAVPLYEQALAIARAVGDRQTEGRALHHLGVRYAIWSQFDTAVPLYEQALAIARETGDQWGEGRTLCALGNLYTTLQQYDTGLVILEQALAVQRAVGDQFGEGWTLDELGRVYTELRQYEKALGFLEQALSLTRTVRDRRQEGWAWLNLGRVHQTLQHYEQALTADEQGLAIAREVGNRYGEGTALAYLGRVHQALGQYDQALTVDAQALLMMREVGHRAGEGTIYGQLMAVWNAQHQPRLAIFYGKRAVNVFQAIRGTLQPLAPELQEGFLTDKAPVYRELAEVLITEGRLLEAQQVLDLLKVEEYLDFVHRDATATALAGRATLTPEEAEWAQRYAAIADRVAALGAERGTLRARSTRTAAEDQHLTQLEADLMAANWAFQRFLTDLPAALGQTPLAQEKVFALRETQGLMADLRDLGPGTVALYTLVGPTTTRVLLITPDVQLAREVPISAADLSRKVVAFREALEAVRHQRFPPDPRPLAHDLYELLIAPVAADLRAVHARTLLWSLDGVLRYLPLAALYDGEHYLLERYALVVFTPASQARLKDAPQPQWQALGLGVSKAHADLPALPGVVRELQEIIRDPAFNATAGVLPGTIKLDEAFTASTLLAALRQGYPVVHIASHFQLRPGDETASFLLLGDGYHLSLTQVKTWPAVLSGVDLLTLSACNTAIGGMGVDGKEVEGFAVLAQRQGAKAVLATLWPVEDSSTQAVMQTFYRLRATQAGLSKAEALRQAQLHLLAGPGPHDAVRGLAPMLSAGGLSPEARQERGLQLVQGPAATQPAGEPPRPASYAHPYFWAPFILIGNWQ